MNGDVDTNLDGTVTHSDDLGGRLDYLGINYYTRAIIDGTTQPFFSGLSPLSTFNPLSSTIYTETPQGIYDMTLWANNHGYPVIITENGTSNPDDPDSEARYLSTHVGWLAQAVAKGAQVGGYFYWTLVDNYEWNHGMQMHFGLFGLDGSSQKHRVARPLSAIYQQITDNHGLTQDLLTRYPLPADDASSP